MRSASDPIAGPDSRAARRNLDLQQKHMTAQRIIERLTPRTRRSFWLGIGMAALVLAATILSGWLLVRSLVREQIARRDAEALHATTLMEQLDERGEMESTLTEEQIGFDAALRASRLRGVIGIRFFDAAGTFKDSFPANVQPTNLGSGALDAMRELRPFGRFTPAMPLDQVFVYLPQFATGHIARTPILEVTVPLYRRDGNTLAGSAQFIVEGDGIAREYARLDRHLAWVGVSALILAALLFGAMLWPVFRQLENVYSQLARERDRLVRANEELALAVRSSALGAVSAHLMHGLKNPLASLAEFLRSRGTVEGRENGDDIEDALTAARRMQALVQHTLEVLADSQGQPNYDVTISEVLDSIGERSAPLAGTRDVTLSLRTDLRETIPSRNANLTGLILNNLVQNAIQATPPGKTVILKAVRSDDRIVFTVRDQGPGFPESMRPRLFLPCKSSREGGSGIGLAISKHLAHFLGAKLELVESTSAGSMFTLELQLEAASPGRQCPAKAAAA